MFYLLKLRFFTQLTCDVKHFPLVYAQAPRPICSSVGPILAKFIPGSFDLVYVGMWCLSLPANLRLNRHECPLVLLMLILNELAAARITFIRSKALRLEIRKYCRHIDFSKFKFQS